MIVKRHWVALVSALSILAIQALPTAGQTVPWREEQEPVRESTAITVGDDALELDISITGPQHTLGLD